MGLNGELARSGIKITKIYPSWADTNMLNSPSYEIKRRKKRLPLWWIHRKW